MESIPPWIIVPALSFLSVRQHVIFDIHNKLLLNSPAFPGARWRAGCQGSPGEPVVLRAPGGPPRKWPNNCARPLLHPAIFHPCCPFSSHISWSQGLYPPPPNHCLLLPASRNPHFSHPFNTFPTSGFYELHLLVSLSFFVFSPDVSQTAQFSAHFHRMPYRDLPKRKVTSIPCHRSTTAPIKQNKNML